MFSANSDKIVNELVIEELKSAIEQHGESFESVDLAKDVLFEEVQEARTEFNYVNNLFFMFYADTKKNYLEEIQNRARLCIKELAQVCAVVEKIKNSAEKK